MQIKRLISVIILLVCMIKNNNVAEASHQVYPELQSVFREDSYNYFHVHKTGYHFQPHKHWINDPNGPMYYKGLFHLFYQYNPEGAVWGNIVWAHSVSNDLINWTPLRPAISPSKSFDIRGCWSGSVTMLPGEKPVILYTGIDPDLRQVQNYAVPKDLSDGFLREWVKPDDNPIIVPTPPMNSSYFRDPTTAWKGPDGYWRTIVGGRHHHRGMAYLYRSRDFKKWVKAKHPLHNVPNTGMWECPDFFPVSMDGTNGLDSSELGPNIKHVFKVSLDETRYEYYTIGTYDVKIDKYTPDNTSEDGWNGLRFDYGNYYASKTFFDPLLKRRILWAWSNESDSRSDDVEKGWAGIMAIPRTVRLDPNGKQLLLWPVEEVETLRNRTHQVEMKKTKLKKGQYIEVKGITAYQADVEVTFSFPSLDKAENFDPSWVNAQDLCAQKGSTVEGGLGPFGLLTLASEKLEEYTPVFFRIFKDSNKHKVLLCSDASSSTTSHYLYKPSYAGFVDVDLADSKLSLRSLIDHSVVESFGEKGKTCITSRVYPDIATMDNAHLYVFNNGSEIITVENLTAWSMKRPVMMNNVLD